MIMEQAVLSTPLHSSVLWLIPFLPLFGAILNGATGRWLKNNKVVDAIALGSVGISFLLVVYTFAQLMGRAPVDRSVTQTVWTWLSLGDAHVLGGLTHNTMSWAYKVDPLSACMGLLVTGVGFLIHLFSTGYMADERKQRRVLPLHGLHEPLRVLHAQPGAGREHDHDVPGLGRGGPLQLPADRLLLRAGVRAPSPARRPSSPTASATSAS